MVKKIVLALAVLVAALLGYAATRPDTFRVERSITLKAAPEKAYPLIEDFRQWAQWSPWEKLDPAMKRNHGATPKGKGAVYEWDGNDKVGSGRMEITDATPPGRVVIKLDFFRPMEGHNTAEFTLQGSGDSTKVTWAMFGPSPYVMKLMGIFMSMDAMVGKDFETGLANLKAAAEK